MQHRRNCVLWSLCSVSFPQDSDHPDKLKCVWKYMKLHLILCIAREGRKSHSSHQACLFSLSNQEWSLFLYYKIQSAKSKVEFMFLPLHWLPSITSSLTMNEWLSVLTYTDKNSCWLTSPRSPSDSYEDWTGQFSVVQLSGRALAVVLWTTASCTNTQQQCIGLNFQMHTNLC